MSGKKFFEWLGGSEHNRKPNKNLRGWPAWAQEAYQSGRTKMMISGFKSHKNHK